MESSSTKASLRGIDSVDGTVAWASGTDGTVLKTVDGGAHWEKCVVPDADKDGATLDFRGVQAWDARTAMVMASGPGAMSRLYKTTDGCRTWGLVFENPDAPQGFFDSFWLNGSRGILVGDPVREQFAVFITKNDGKTWTLACGVCCKQQLHSDRKWPVHAGVRDGREERRNLFQPPFHAARRAARDDRPAGAERTSLEVQSNPRCFR
jgi:photosystem II stability/assembly factor-like uncharacterized protein